MNFFGKKKGEATPSKSEMALLNSTSWDDEIKEQVQELREEAQVAESAAPQRVITLRPEFTINELLEMLVDMEGSDLHLAVGSYPAFRLHGSLVFSEGARLTQEKADQGLPSMVYGERAA